MIKLMTLLLVATVLAGCGYRAIPGVISTIETDNAEALTTFMNECISKPNRAFHYYVTDWDRRVPGEYDTPSGWEAYCNEGRYFPENE